MAVGCWFFDRRLEGEHYAGCFTPFVCLYKVLRYHTGTAAFGSFLIAIVKLARAILLKVQKSLKKKTKGSYCAAPIDVAICCCQCALWCLEKCIRFVSRQAYIQTALVGHNFLKAARIAFELIANNIGSMATVSLVGEFIIVIGQCFATVGAGAAAYYYFSHYMADELHGVVVPTLVVALLAFGTSMMFTSVMGLTIDTILQCFLYDQQENGGAYSHVHRKGLEGWLEENKERNDEADPDEDVHAVSAPPVDVYVEENDTHNPIQQPKKHTKNASGWSSLTSNLDRRSLSQP